ncbi:MAG: energy transducer TonB [Gemmatimonadetes bacterium]|nr:energy transducer TonB [Gemmatimonadota bacterium]
MFNTLLESKAPRPSVIGGGSLSGAVHVLLIWGAVVATANAGQRLQDEPQQSTRWIDVVKPRVPEPPKPQPTAPGVPALARGFRLLIAPLDVPDALPAIDLTRAVTRPEDYTGTGVPGGVGGGIVGITPVDPTQTYFDFDVEKPVVLAPGSAAPRYPELLKAAGVEGDALAEFVVDTAGRAELATFKVLQSSHELFTLAVRNALGGMRFLPAEVGGRKVKQLVRQTFVFAIQR